MLSQFILFNKTPFIGYFIIGTRTEPRVTSLGIGTFKFLLVILKYLEMSGSILTKVKKIQILSFLIA